MKRTAEHNRRIAEALKGRTFSEAHLHGLRLAAIKRGFGEGPKTEEHQRKICAALTGTRRSPEICAMFSAINSGENNPNWQGGKADERHRLAASTKWHRCKLKVRLRDKHCRMCLEDGSRIELQYHHIIPVALRPDLFFEVSNVVRLCRVCHEALKSREVWWAPILAAAIEHNKNSVIYVPTEASLPILEAGRRPEQH